MLIIQRLISFLKLFKVTLNNAQEIKNKFVKHALLKINGVLTRTKTSIMCNKRGTFGERKRELERDIIHRLPIIPTDFKRFANTNLKILKFINSRCN